MSNLLIVLVSLVFGVILTVGVILLCLYIIVTHPHSKLSGWIRRYIVTDVDLEP